MLIPIQRDRLSDSPFVERIWHAHSEYTGDFTSIAMSHWEMVVTKLRHDNDHSPWAGDQANHLALS